MIDYHVSDGVCLLRLNSPPLNAIDLAMLEALRKAIARASGESEVRGIVITGDAEHFSAGADVGLFRQIASADDAVHISRAFQEAFAAVEDSSKPVVAAVAGKVIAGALEFAMACHFRVAGRRARFSMQEINLAINPGAGGTQRLPRLVGPGKALKMLLTAETIGAGEALELGLVDAVCEGDQLIERARELLRSAPVPQKTSRRTDKLGDHAATRAAFDEAEKLAAGMRPEIIAPRKIIDAVKAGLEESADAGLVREQTGFAECMATPAAQNKIYLFFAIRQTSKVPDLAEARPLRVARAAVIGMGTMGSGIVQALIGAGVPVVARDEDEAALAKGTERIQRSIQKRVSQGRLSGDRAEEMLGLVSTTTRWDEIADADLAIEAVFEDVDVKRAVLREIERACRPEVVVASNTSTISLDVLADAMDRPERLVGMHFFNPAQRMPLVEVIRRAETRSDVVATAVGLAKRLRKTPVVVRNREGFLVNRVFLPYVKEAFWLLEEGADAEAIDRAMVDFGFPMGPLTLMDMAGLDILVATDRVLCLAFAWHGPLSQIAIRLVDDGHLGQKRGSGVYKYEKGDYTPHHSPSAQGIVAEVRAGQGRSPREVPPREITERLVLRMVSEAFRVMEEGVAGRESDLDVAMTLGTGFPDFRGGVLRYAHDLGLDRVVGRLDALADKCGERFSPCRLLRERKGA
ncbi:MAG TPA: 3-hydroxyacyl-CoA dehydrogenase NAD-binding domain-containing protein [Thermoguttaceae bacterium]|nr:3-hydroxyacyl-CoA dehydrogenase NAD-binding domain-containing protein [Thermoguttaceae bacterium]